MKRLALVVSAALAFLVMAALPALAEYGDTTVVHGAGGGAGGGTAFTGANISLGLILVGALVVAGITALVAGRRRASASE